MPNPSRTPKPHWLRRRLPTGPAYEAVRSMIKKGHLHTVCQAAQCPNQFECFSHHTATFLILGDRCTRNCRFCAVAHGPQGAPDPHEPERVAQAAAAMNLRYVVVTSVTRDDLADGGSKIFADTIAAIRKKIDGARVEVLIPDFQGNPGALKTVLEAGPDVLNHNLETVSRLYPRVRPEADYAQSLELIRRTNDWAPQIPAKSGLMLGLGESEAELLAALKDLRRSGCRLLTLGQYLQPTKAHLPVHRFVPPEEFDRWKDTALDLGFERVASGPFVRIS